MLSMDDESLPFAGTRAAAMLKDALARHTAAHRGGLRALAAQFGMKQATVLSHMATGRIAIPLDRVVQFASALEIDASDFAMAVLEQREPSVHALLTAYECREQGQSLSPYARSIIDLVKGAENLTANHVSTIKEVLRPNASVTRWASQRESELLQLIRDSQPMGFSDGEWSAFLAGVRLLLED